MWCFLRIFRRSGCRRWRARFGAVDGGSGAEAVAARVAEYADAGLTHVILHAVGDGFELEDFARLAGQEVRPLVG